MTEILVDSDAATAELLRVLLRRAGHELRNAQNAVAVNVEALRSRSSKGASRTNANQPFADNAARGLEDTTRLAEALVALCAALFHCILSGNLSRSPGKKGGSRLELRMEAPDADRFISALTPVAGRLRASVEAAGAGVILTILDENEAT